MRTVLKKSWSILLLCIAVTFGACKKNSIASYRTTKQEKHYMASNHKRKKHLKELRDRYEQPTAKLVKDKNNKLEEL